MWAGPRRIWAGPTSPQALPCARPLRAPFGCVRPRSAPLGKEERGRVRRRRAGLLLHSGLALPRVSTSLSSELYPGRCFPHCLRQSVLDCAILGLLLLLVQANKVFLSFFFSSNSFNEGVNSPGLPGWRRCLDRRAPAPGERLGSSGFWGRRSED